MRKQNKFILVSLLASMALLASCGQGGSSSSNVVSSIEQSASGSNSSESGSDSSSTHSSSESEGESSHSSSSSSSSSSGSNSSSSSSASSSSASSSSSSASSSSASSNSSSEEQSRKATIVFGTEPLSSSVSTVIDASRFSVNGVGVKDVSAENCYSNAKGKAARFSSSKKDGYLELTLSSSIHIRSLKAYTFLYKDSEAASLTLKASSFSGSKSVSGTAYSENNYLLFENIGTTSFLRIEGKRSKRFYLAKIELEIVSSSGDVSSSSSSSSSSSGESGSSSQEEEKGYYDVELSAIQKYRLDNFEDYGILGAGNLPSIGSPKLLVVPVYFKGDAAPSNRELDSIQKAFFGESGDTGWESLSSYYQKSSYGKLTIKGTVTDAFQYSLSADDFQTAFEKGEKDSAYKDTNDIVTEAVSWAKTKGFLNKTFDSNADGYYDGIDLVYFTDKTVNDNKDLWWAYTTGTGLKANVSSPVANRYFWSPMSMIENGYYSPDIDTHTLIHETGHMLGLDDYYSYERDENSYVEAPCGMVDMMDCNVGDHDAYSKMLMGWCSPKVVTGMGSFSITLNSFADTGEFLLVPSSSWNGTPYDEYMILQYYTPTGLNAKDSNGYEEFSSSAYGHGGTYLSSGLQAFHVDSRVFSYRATTSSYSDMKYSEDPTFIEKELSDGSSLINGWIAASNTASYSVDVKNSDINSENLAYNSKNRLITILPASGTSAFLSSGFEKNFGSMSNLYTASGYNSYTNEKLSNCYQNNGKFNNGDTFPYRFFVSNQTASSITVNFTRL